MIFDLPSLTVYVENCQSADELLERLLAELGTDPPHAIRPEGIWIVVEGMIVLFEICEPDPDRKKYEDLWGFRVHAEGLHPFDLKCPTTLIERAQASTSAAAGRWREGLEAVSEPKRTKKETSVESTSSPKPPGRAFTTKELCERVGFQPKGSSYQAVLGLIFLARTAGGIAWTDGAKRNTHYMFKSDVVDRLRPLISRILLEEDTNGKEGSAEG